MSIIITKTKFKEYENLRPSGVFNMFDLRATELTSLSRIEWIDIIKNYKMYNDKWGEISI